MKNFDALMARMSLEDKLMQMTQLLGADYITEDYGTFMGLSHEFKIDDYMAWNTGSLLGIGGAKSLRRIQKEYLRRSKNKIPLLFMQDVIHGYRTIFPSVIAMACSWQPELVEKAAEISAKEAAVAGIHVTFSPMADLVRDARWGRVVESTGEDPYLNGLYAAATVRGYQGKNVKDRFRIAACVKHFAGYGMAEAGREYNTTEISEYSLRENHFPAYKAAVDAGAKMVMTSFNALNGIPSSGNEWLYRTVLRGEWNFAGAVISDCTAIDELIRHGFAEDEREAALKALRTGVDIEMVSTTYFRHARELIESGELDPAVIDRAVLRILELKDQLGLFENPYKDADEELEKKLLLCPAHREFAREAARNSIVLLKNNGVLPLRDRSKTVALLGPYAESRELVDIWSDNGKIEECVSLSEGLEGKLKLRRAKGCGLLKTDEAEKAEALRTAGECDLVVLALGEPRSWSAEAGSRAYLTLPGGQAQFAHEVFALGKPVVVVLFSGRPLELGEIDQKADAILEAWYPGTEGGNALADLLLGDAEPSARLTISFPFTVGQCPIYYNQYPTGRPKPDETVEERFLSRYVDAPNAPAYPFGHGLTYTAFEYGPVVLSSPTLRPGGRIVAAAALRNTGNRSGTETVQLYLRDLAGSMVRPVKMLRGFRRVFLEPGQECRVQFEITEEMLAFHTMQGGFAAEKGKFIVFIAQNAMHDNGAGFELV